MGKSKRLFGQVGKEPYEPEKFKKQYDHRNYYDMPTAAGSEKGGVSTVRGFDF